MKPPKHWQLGDAERAKQGLPPKDEALKSAMESIPMVGDPETYRQRLADFITKGYLSVFHKGFLDTTTDKVFAHKPKPKSKPARKRARRAKKIAQAADSQ